MNAQTAMNRAESQVEPIGPEDLLAQKDQAERGFEVGHGVAVLFDHGVGAGQNRRSVRIGENGQDLVDGIAALRRIFAVALRREFAAVELVGTVDVIKVLMPSSIQASRRSLKPTNIGNQPCPISCAATEKGGPWAAIRWGRRPCRDIPSRRPVPRR